MLSKAISSANTAKSSKIIKAIMKFASIRCCFSSLAFATLLLSACKNNDSPQKINILGENSSTIQAMQALKDDYEKEGKTKLDFKPNSFEDAFNKANQDFANKTALYDIVLQYNFSLSSFARNKYVYNLDELKDGATNADYSFESEIFPNVWKEVGHYYKDPANPNASATQVLSYPFAANTMLLIYNRELFEDAEQRKNFQAKYGRELAVPTDLKSFREVAEFFTQPDKELKGVCIEGSTGGWLYYEWCSFLQGFGGKVMDKSQGWEGNATTPILLDNEKAVAATEYYLSLKPFNAGNYVTTDGVEQKNIILKGKVAMGIVWSDYAWGYVSDDKGQINNRFGFAPTPGDKSMIAGGAYFVNRQTKHKVQAFDYITWLLKKETQVQLIQKGLCAPTKSAYDAPEAQKIPYVPALKQSLLRAEYMLEAGPDADLISTTITTYLQKMWNGEMRVKDGLSAAKRDIEQGRPALFKN